MSIVTCLLSSPSLIYVDRPLSENRTNLSRSSRPPGNTRPNCSRWCVCARNKHAGLACSTKGTCVSVRRRDVECFSRSSPWRSVIEMWVDLSHRASFLRTLIQEMMYCRDNISHITDIVRSLFLSLSLSLHAGVPTTGLAELSICDRRRGSSSIIHHYIITLLAISRHFKLYIYIYLLPMRNMRRSARVICLFYRTLNAKRMAGRAGEIRVIAV